MGGCDWDQVNNQDKITKNPGIRDIGLHPAGAGAFISNWFVRQLSSIYFLFQGALF
jgi:hypothetical protein